MKKYLSFIRKVFSQNGFLTGFLSLVSAGSLFLVFRNGWDLHPLASLSYALSAYSLTACILFVLRRIPHWKRRIQALPAVQKWKADPILSKRVRLYSSFFVGILLVAYKLIAALCYDSAWFMSMAFYYAVLSLQRGLILRVELGKSKHLDCNSVGRICGWLMLLLSMSILGMRILLFRNAERIVYPGHMIYAVAMYAFYNMTMAIVHALRKRGQDVMPTVYRHVQLAAACVSILFLQAALLAAFSDHSRAAQFANLATGTVTALFVLVMGIYMIVGDVSIQKGNR